MWQKAGYQAVGGLKEIGFVAHSEMLMVLGGNGRTVFDCLTAEKVARDRTDYYAEAWDANTGIVEGFDQWEGQSIVCGGFEYPGQLVKITKDNWCTLIKKERRQDYKKDWELAEVMYLTHQSIQQEIEVDIYHYGITRSYGFSPSGKTFVTAHTHGLNFWKRNK